MRCAYCGMANPTSVIFCRKCGRRLGSITQVPSSSSSPSAAPPATVPLLMNAPQQDDSILVLSPPARRSRHRRVWILVGVVFTLLAAGSGFAFVETHFLQSPISAAQTLLTYCSALTSGEYQQAYNLLARSYRQQKTEDDFAYLYQSHKGVTTCVVSNVSESASSATGTVQWRGADGSSETDTAQLLLENGAWKIEGQSPG